MFSFPPEDLVSQFNVQVNKNIPGYDDSILTGIAIDDCASACLKQNAWVCNSFTFCFDTGYCVLSKLHPDERPSVVVNKPLCDLYSSKWHVTKENNLKVKKHLFISIVYMFVSHCSFLNECT